MLYNRLVSLLEGVIDGRWCEVLAFLTLMRHLIAMLTIEPMLVLRHVVSVLVLRTGMVAFIAALRHKVVSVISVLSVAVVNDAVLISEAMFVSLLIRAHVVMVDVVIGHLMRGLSLIR